MPLLADSARDVTYSIEHIDRTQEFMRVKYWVSGDSSFPELQRNYQIYEFDDASIHETAQSGLIGVNYKWRKLLGEYDSFNADSYYGQEWSVRYKVRVRDSHPFLSKISELRNSVVLYDSEDNDTIHTKYSIVAKDSNEAEMTRSGIQIDAVTLRQSLSRDGRLDSLQSIYGLDSGSSADDVARIQFEYKDILEAGDSLGINIKNFLGLNDSDWAVYLINAGDIDQFPG